MVCDEHAGHSHLRLVGGGEGDLGVRLGEEVGDGGDGIGAVGANEVDQGPQVAAGRVVGGVVLQIAPAGKDDEFGVVSKIRRRRVNAVTGTGFEVQSGCPGTQWLHPRA